MIFDVLGGFSRFFKVFEVCQGFQSLSMLIKGFQDLSGFLKVFNGF